MEILILSEETYPRHAGGSGKCSHTMAAGLAARGHAVHLLSQTDGSPVRERIDDVEVHRVAAFEPDRRGADRADSDTARHLLDYMRQEIPLSSLDLVHDSGGFLSYFFPLALELKRAHGLPLIVHFRYLLHRHHMVTAPRGTYGPFSRTLVGMESRIPETTQCFAVRIADLVISPSSEGAELTRELFHPQGVDVVVVPDAVEPDRTPLDGSSQRARLAKPGETLVLFGGRIGSDLKGSDIVLRAFQRITRRNSAVRLLLATADQDAVTPFKEQLGAAVTALGWIRDASELGRILAAADVVIMPSRYEAFGMMCAEAMAAGTPVVGSAVGGLRDLIVHGETGFLLQGLDPGAWDRELSELILRLAADPELAGTMGAKARSFAMEQLTLEKTSAQLESLYHGLLRQRPDTVRREVAPPPLSRRGEERYLKILDGRGGSEAQAAGETVLRDWPESSDRRCLACTRKRIGEDTRRLLRMGRSGWVWRMVLPAALRRRLAARVVRQLCPLALLQKDLVHRAEPVSRPE